MIRSFDQQTYDLNGKTILVTGGTGSFGHSLVELVIKKYTPRRLIIFSRDEFKQYEMSQKYPPAEHPFLRFFIGDVRDQQRLEFAMRGVDVVVHAAAMKQVGASEYNPFECIHTNVIGAENIIRSAIRSNVEKVIALSTDKAANPVNLYGASKLAADKIFVAGNHLGGATGTRFSVVRYGNVIGSRGSVVEVFNKLISEGAESLPITDARMTRFWINLHQATNFVMSCFAMMAGGEVFVPKIPSMSIPHLAEAMAPDLKTHIIGIRAGEKLHETMITEDDSRNTYEIDDRYVIEPMLDLQIPSLRERFGEQAVPVADGFAYTSDSNKEWMDVETLRRDISEKHMQQLLMRNGRSPH